VFYSIGKFSKAIGVSIETLRLWDKQDKLKPEKVRENGYRYYSQKQIDEYLGVKISSSRVVIGYCRVSSHKQKKGKRANKDKKIIKELMKNDSSEES
jgi:DNA-binding transcriptional MerR regulator